MTINGLKFECTCNACPEQYDVFDQRGEIVGYVRLRWGRLTCEVPDALGELIYCVHIGDRSTGRFESDGQRLYHLSVIADKIQRRMFVKDGIGTRIFLNMTYDTVPLFHE